MTRGISEIVCGTNAVGAGAVPECQRDRPALRQMRGVCILELAHHELDRRRNDIRNRTRWMPA